MYMYMYIAVVIDSHENIPRDFVNDVYGVNVTTNAANKVHCHVYTVVDSCSMSI